MPYVYAQRGGVVRSRVYVTAAVSARALSKQATPRRPARSGAVLREGLTPIDAHARHHMRAPSSLHEALLSRCNWMAVPRVCWSHMLVLAAPSQISTHLAHLPGLSNTVNSVERNYWSQNAARGPACGPYPLCPITPTDGPAQNAASQLHLAICHLGRVLAGCTAKCVGGGVQDTEEPCQPTHVRPAASPFTAARWPGQHPYLRTTKLQASEGSSCHQGLLRLDQLQPHIYCSYRRGQRAHAGVACEEQRVRCTHVYRICAGRCKLAAASNVPLHKCSIPS